MQPDAAIGALAGAAGSSEVLRDAALAVSALAGTGAVLPLTADAAFVLCLLRDWRGALTIVLAVMSTQAVVMLVKAWVERPRPAANAALAQADGFSFPSAHSASSVALYGTLVFLAERASRAPARMALVGAGAALIAAIGLSRVLLAAHYPTDVLAGWLTGATLVTASWLVARRMTAPWSGGRQSPVRVDHMRIARPESHAQAQPRGPSMAGEAGSDVCDQHTSDR